MRESVTHRVRELRPGKYLGEAVIGATLASVDMNTGAGVWVGGRVVARCYSRTYADARAMAFTASIVIGGARRSKPLG